MHLLFAALALDALFSSATLSGAHSGAIVVEAQSGRVVYARNADDAFVPASTMKLIVGSAALDRLGEGFSFTTALAADGTSFYLKGGGDPLLSPSDAAQAAAAVAALDLRPAPSQLAGDISRYTAPHYPDGWQVDDLPYDYAAPSCALSFDENAFHITAVPAAQSGAPPTITIAPVTAAMTVVNHATTGAPRSEDTSALQFDWRTSRNVVVTGSVPADSSPAPVLDAAFTEPAAETLDAFSRAFAAQGILMTVSGYAPTPPDARVVWQHASARLPQLLAKMWQPSDNLLAETLLQELGVASRGATDTRAAGIEAERRWLQSIGVDRAHVTIADGSGMSAYDRVTPRALVAILAHDWNGASRATVLAALPVAGRSGTLEHAFTRAPLAGNVIAKTGTSNHTRTLAGYLETPHGTLIFALLVNDWTDDVPDAAARLRSFQEAFLTRIRDAASGV